MAPVKRTTSNASVAATSSPCAPPPAGGPGGPLEIVFTFDTTGSMYSCLTEVRKKLEEIIRRLFADIPNLRIAVFAHGDYCDRSTYVTKYVDFTNDVQKLCDFVNKVKATGGGDWEECYELVMRQTRELLTWNAGTQRAMVMIGDAIPHPVNDPQNKKKIDWKEEANKLRDEMGVRVYAVQAYQNESAKSFWEDVAKMTMGKHLNLEQFGTIADMMMAICYKEHGAEFFEAYEREVRAREGAGIRKELDRMFDTLRDPAAADASTDAATSTAPASAAPALAKVPTGKGGARRPAGKFAAAVGALKKATSTKISKPKTTVYKRSKTTVAAKKILKKAKAGTSADDDCVKYKIGKRFRETVPETEFAFNNLDWTSWQLAMASEMPDGDKADSWTPRRHGSHGVRRCTYSMNDMTKPAVYEFAVQPGDGRRKYTVYLRTTTGSTSYKGHWETNIIKKHKVNEQITGVLQKGSKIYVRKARLEKPATCNGQLVKSVHELKNLMRQTYDYAWMKQSNQIHARNVVKNGQVVSSSAF